MPHNHPRSPRIGTAASVRRFRVSASIVLCLLALALDALGARPQTLTPPTPQDLLGSDPAAFVQWLKTARPRPVSPEDKARFLRSLPEHGEVTKLNASTRRKLAAVSSVLRHAARDSIYVVKIIDVPQAAVGLYARTVVLISEATLALLSAEELQAQVAHEIGHEYVWVEYERAREIADHERLKQLELLCDAVAIVTLSGLGLDVSRLMAGIEKIARFNRKRLGPADNEGAYPTLSERRAYARAVAAWTAAASAKRAPQVGIDPQPPPVPEYR